MEVFSYLNDVLFAKPCPNCQISIFKDGGCDLVTCTNWCHKFWWYCQGTHNGAKSSQSENCFIPRIFTPLMALWALLMLNFHFWHSASEDAYAKILNWATAASELVSTAILLMIYVCLLGGEVVLVCWSKVQKEQEIRDSGKVIKVAFFLSAVVYPFVWMFGFYSCFLWG